MSVDALDWMGKAASGLELSREDERLVLETRLRLQRALSLLEQWPCIGGDVACGLEETRRASRALEDIAQRLRLRASQATASREGLSLVRGQA